MIVQLKHIFYFCVVLALSSSYLPGVIGRPNDTVTSPKMLEDFGYAFNEEGKLRKINKDDGSLTDEPFQFEISSERSTNQAHYDALGEAVSEHVYQMMQDIGLHKIYVPSTTQSSFVFGTKTNFANTKKLLFIIHGAGKVRAGEWARSLIINHSLDHGTQIPYIKRAIAEGYDVLVTNTNYNYRTENGQRVQLEGNGSPEEHIKTVWEELIEPVYDSIEAFGVVAHSYGGIVTLRMARDHPDAFSDKCFGIAFTDSVHSDSRLPRDLNDWFHKNARNFVTSSKPLNTDLKSGPRGVPCFSSGHTKHEWTSWAAFDALFPYMEEKYQEFLNRE